jgi:hypothetical protein
MYQGAACVLEHYHWLKELSSCLNPPTLLNQPAETADS